MLDSTAMLLATLALTPGPRGPEVELVAPSPGTVLEAGETAWLEWAADEDLRAAGFVEWEAFLSVDGGEYFGIRLTPHLDIGVRRFAFEVPSILSEDARLLLRVGDETKEVSVDVPGRFAIRDGAQSRLVRPAFRGERGEAARPGESGVVLWLDGSRHATGLRSRRAASGEALGSPRVRVAMGPWATAAPLPSAPKPGPAPEARRVVPLQQGVASAFGPTPASAPDLLLMQQRRNE